VALCRKSRPRHHKEPFVLFSVIIPACNEASVIARCLSNLLEGARPGEFEVLVVCNGCSDDTADIARGFGDPVKVLESEVPSKVHALNLGDRIARGFPRLYLDADIVIDLASVRRIVEVLDAGPALAAAPRPENVFLPGTRWPVRVYYRFWKELPYVQEGMIAAGAYAMSEAGRQRFDQFPDVVADDGYVRMVFEPHERVQAAGAISHVLAPLTLADLVRTRTRSRLGVLQLRQKFPDLAHREAKTKRYVRSLFYMLRKYEFYIGAPVYGFVIAVSWLRARRQLSKIAQYVWERDESSRTSVSEA
jgi:glycosyltransferase involved in cell wall biosynthesis